VPERALAEQLARALDGEHTGLEEADRLALLLRTAADPYKVDVDAQTTERAAAGLARAAPAARRLRGPIAAVALVAAAAAAFVLLPRSAPGIDVEAQAAVAIDRTGPTYRVVSITHAPGAGVLRRIQWTGAAGRTRVQVLANGRLIEDLLREPGGRVLDYQGRLHRVVIAPSCAALAGMCSELADPVSFYRARLQSAEATAVTAVRFFGRSAYRFTLPAQALGGETTRISQVVTVDATTFLPRRIVWLEQAGGSTHVVAVIDVRSIAPISPDSQAMQRMTAPRATPVVQVDAVGRTLGPASVRAVTPAQAAARFPHGFWLGRSFHGLRLTRLREYSWGRAGAALRLDYGPLVLWNFSTVIPHPLVEGRLLPGKELATGATSTRFYVSSSGRLVAERDFAGGSIAVIAPELRKLDMFQAVTEVRPLNPTA
jgi:hypothetical protein